ncbi:hypothetical protein HDU86_004438 [Geranomyces michiganensis]|nr:hypothetical protein HDU86_004438 [Geranomyces michiganensis]
MDRQEAIAEGRSAGEAKNGPPPHILKPSPAKVAAALSQANNDDAHAPQSLADWNSAGEQPTHDHSAAAAPTSDHQPPPSTAAVSSPPQKRPIILEIVNGTDRRSKKAANNPAEPAFTAPFPHPSEPGKIILRNPWDDETIVLDREEEERAAREFFRAHVAEVGGSGAKVSDRALAAGAGDEEEEKRASVAAELVPTVAGVEEGGFAMGALLPPLVDFLSVPDSEGSASPGPPSRSPQQQQVQPQQQQMQPQQHQERMPLPPQQQQQQQHQQQQPQVQGGALTSFEAEMLAIFETVRSSIAPANPATLAALASTTTQQQPLTRDKVPAPPLITPGGKVFTPAIPPPNRSPPKPPVAATQQAPASAQPPPRQQQQSQPQLQRSAPNRPSMEKARSSLDKVQSTALGLAADLDANDGDASAASAAAGATGGGPVNSVAAGARTPAASPKGVITPTVLSAKRVQVTPANRVGPAGGNAGSPATAYTTTSGSVSGGGSEPPRMVREKSAADGALLPSSGNENALPLPDVQKQKGVSG